LNDKLKTIRNFREKETNKKSKEEGLK